MTCFSIIRHLFDTIIVVSIDKGQVMVICQSESAGKC